MDISINKTELVPPYDTSSVLWIERVIKDNEDYLLCTYDEVKDHNLISIPEKAFLFYYSYPPHQIISCISTNPASKRQGLGSMLIHKVKLPILVCTRKEVKIGNDFYLSLGFNQIGEVQKKWKKFTYELNVYVKEK